MKKYLSGILSLVIALAVLELLSRAAFTFVADTESEKKKQEDWFVYSPELGWERKPGFNNNIAAVNRQFDENGFLIGDAAKHADSTKKKILFIGDSNTFGNDYPIDKIFTSLVDSLLAGAVTINLAAPGYSSYHGKIVLHRALQKFRPDVIVASFSYNDRRYVLNADDVDGAAAFQRIYELSKRQQWLDMLERSYVFRALRFGLRGVGFISEEATKPVVADSLQPRVSPQDYGQNLSEIAELAQREQIPLLFLLLGDNPIQTHYVLQGVGQLERAQPDSAIESLIISSRESTLFTVLARRYLEKAYLKVGNREEARKVSIIEKPSRSLQGGYPIRLDREYNQIMRRVGEKFQVEIVDGANELEQQPSVYYDFCHFDERGHRRIAELLAPHLRNILSKTNEAANGAASP